MKVTICDDKIEYIEELIHLCSQFAKDRSLDLEVNGTADPKEIYDDLPDILILDIEMPEISGIEIKNRLAAGDKPLIIFASSYPENMPEAFGKNVIGFLCKPIQPIQLERMMESAVSLLTMDEFIPFEDNSMICTKDILMIVVAQNYTDVHLVDGTVKRGIRKSLKLWEQELSDYGFIRINESSLLNCRYIQNIEGTNVLFHGNQVLQISRRKKDECFGKFMAYKRKVAKYI